MIDQWYGFFAAQVAATAALLGLLFVALSVNIARIMRFSWLPSRAGLTLVVLLGALLESSLALFPTTFARFEVGASLVVAAVVYAFAWRLSDLVRKVPAQWKAHPNYRRASSVNLVSVQLATTPAVVGAALLLAGGSGYPWLAVGVLFSLVYGILNSWVLLVEILR
jgi:hypothetical protein